MAPFKNLTFFEVPLIIPGNESIHDGQADDLYQNMTPDISDDPNQDHVQKSFNESASKLMTTLFSPFQSDTNRSITSSNSGHFLDDKDFFISSLEAERENDEDILERFLNNSKVISDVPGIIGSPNTPLTAPELGLVNVHSVGNWTQGGNILFSDNDHTKELAWLIPAVVGAIFVFILIAYVCFYGLRALEMKCMRCCFTVFGCCRPGGRQGIGDETEALTSHMSGQETEMKAYRSQSATQPSLDFDLGKYL